MNKKSPPTESFASLMEDIKPYHQDKRHFKIPLKNKIELSVRDAKLQAVTYFSDTYQPLLPSDGPMRWRKSETDPLELKRLRRGDYIPELLLDLHGMRQSEAKLEIAALINACIKESIQCCSVMHGHGAGILKQMVPMWLAQHPHIKAFHQATKEWGGNAALLILIDLGDAPHRR